MWPSHGFSIFSNFPTVHKHILSTFLSFLPSPLSLLLSLQEFQCHILSFSGSLNRMPFLLIHFWEVSYTSLKSSLTTHSPCLLSHSALSRFAWFSHAQHCLYTGYICLCALYAAFFVSLTAF